VLLVLELEVFLVLALVGDVEFLVAKVQIDECLPEGLPFILEFQVFVTIFAELGFLLFDFSESALDLADFLLDCV